MKSVNPPVASKCSILLVLSILCWVSAGTEQLIGEDWTQFRGGNLTGTTTETNLPAKWDEETNVAWKKELPGRAWSSPIIVGKRLFVTNAVPEDEQEPPKKGLYFGGNRKKPRDTNYTWSLICLDKTNGNVLWEKVCAAQKPVSAIHLKNSYASETPVSDGKHVYVYFGAVGVFCFDLDGNSVWKKQWKPLETRFGWGTSSSPVVDDANLYIQSDNEESSFLVALDKKTGNEVWRKEREEKSSWGSPFLWKTKTSTELVTTASKKARGYDPKSGELLWELSGHSTISCPTPIASEELLYISSGYVMDKVRPIYAIKPGSVGDLSAKDGEFPDSIAWYAKRGGPYNPSPVLYKGTIYVLYDKGFLAGFDAKTGDTKIKLFRIDENKSGFTSSPWAYDDKLFCLNEDGECFVFDTTNKCELLHVNSIGEMCMATPAISDGYLFIRGDKHLFAIK